MKAEEAAKKIKMFIFDVDGSLSDGGIYVGNDGELFKRFDVKDGFAVNSLADEGYLSAIITGRQSEIVEKRAKRLRITAVWQGNPDKRGAYKELKEKFSLSDEEIAFVGDDLIDLPIMVQTGLPIAVADAAEEVKERSLLVTKARGGHGAVREAIEFVLKAQGRWEKLVEKYLK